MSAAYPMKSCFRPVAPVVPCVEETFADGLDAYAVVEGNAALFTIGSGPYGAQLNAASHASGPVSTIRRTFAEYELSALTCKFVVVSAAPDDACGMGLSFLGASVVGLAPRRETAFDALSRPRLSVHAESLALLPAACSIGVWYQLDLAIAAGLGNTVATLTQLTSGAVTTTIFAGDHAPGGIDALGFSIDAGTALSATAQTSYADIDLC